MRYMLLIYNDPAGMHAPGTPGFAEAMTGYFRLNERLKADGAMRGGDALKGVETATSLRIRSGRVETMDGPFAETREHLGGYYVIDVPDLDAALAYAAMVPAAHHGTVEIRPLMDYNPAG